MLQSFSAKLAIQKYTRRNDCGQTNRSIRLLPPFGCYLKFPPLLCLDNEESDRRDKVDKQSVIIKVDKT